MKKVPKDYKKSVGEGWTIETLSELTRQTLWGGPIHPARQMDPVVLYRELEKGVALGLAKKQSEGDLHIYHYSQAVQVNPTFWTKEILLARGIILRVSEQTNGTVECPQVVATPWPKFFNYQQDGISVTELNQKMVRWEVTNKMDGSLGLVFFDPISSRWRCVTKGSFTSEQSVWATEFLRKNIDLKGLVEGTTYLVEIIYIENTIVIPYEYEGLVLLGAFNSNGMEMTHQELREVHKQTQTQNHQNHDDGDNDEQSKHPPSHSPSPSPSHQHQHQQQHHRCGFRLVTMYEAFDSLAALKEEVAGWDGRKYEGVVIRYMFTNGASHRVKVKGDHYKALHRVCTGITPKSILRSLTLSESEFELLRNDTPEEFIDWFDKHAASFRAQAEAVVAEVVAAVELAVREGKCMNKGELGRWLKGRERRVDGSGREYQVWPDGSPVTRAQSSLIFQAFDDVVAFDMEWRQCECELHACERPVKVKVKVKVNMCRERIFRHVVVDTAGAGAGMQAERDMELLGKIRPVGMMVSERRWREKHEKEEQEEKQEIVVIERAVENAALAAAAPAPSTAQVVLKRQL